MKERLVIITADENLLDMRKDNTVVILVEEVDLYNSESLIKNIRVAQRMQADRIEIDYSSIKK